MDKSSFYPQSVDKMVITLYFVAIIHSSYKITENICAYVDNFVYKSWVARKNVGKHYTAVGMTLQLRYSVITYVTSLKVVSEYMIYLSMIINFHVIIFTMRDNFVDKLCRFYCFYTLWSDGGE